VHCNAVDTYMAALSALAATMIIFTCATDLFDSELSDYAWLYIRIIVHTQIMLECQ